MEFKDSTNQLDLSFELHDFDGLEDLISFVDGELGESIEKFSGGLKSKC